MTIKKAPAKPQTIKHEGRKYVVIHRSVTLMLIKRAGKPHHFTLEGGKDGTLKRHKDFWAALKHYSDRQDALGIKGHAVTAVVGTEAGPVVTEGEIAALELMAAQGKAHAEA